MIEEGPPPPPESVPRWGVVLTGITLALWLVVNLGAEPIGAWLTETINAIELSWIPR